ncbi:nuclease-related domain-containing protein [Cerasibacillus sp.]|uniref:nuclease-related domain-containing protein n=1 Tax=Cerasibacillus sp. TaxID=2498711 RepID=UPI0039C881D1
MEEGYASNYSGWIFGNETNRNWMKILKGGRKYPFFNPVWQNNKHIKCVKSFV